MSTQLRKIQFNSGVNRNTTTYNAENWWVDCDKVRFRNGRPEKIGGWVKESVEYFNDSTITTFTGVARDAHVWTDLTFKKYFVSASHKKIEQFNGNQIFDITPIRDTRILANAISTTLGSSIVQVTAATHNLRANDFVIFDNQAFIVDGISLSGEYSVIDVIDPDTFTVDFEIATATGTTPNAGGSINIDFLLECGDQNNGNVTGYGGAEYDTPGVGGLGYGAPRGGVGGTFLRQWSLDNWGEDLIACVREGKLYQWDATVGLGSRLQEIPNAPVENYMALVSQPSRHLVVFGTVPSTGTTLEPLTVRWSEQELLENWDITATNTAGEYRLPLGNYIVSVVQTKSEIIIFTDTNVYSMRFVGGNEVFQFDIIANNVTAASQHCAVDVNGIVYWQGIDNFYMYDGVVRTLDNTLDESIFDQDGEHVIDFSQKEKVYCSTNNEFNEIMWLYQSVNASEVDRYVIYNTSERVWYDGSIDRTVWVDRSIFANPYALDESGVLYVHEEGKDDDGSPMLAYLQSGDVDLEDGEQIIFIDKFIPDFKLDPNRNANLYLTYKMYPSEDGVRKGPYVFNNNTGKINLRGRGRHLSLRYEVDALGADFEVGAPRFSIQPDGER